jgi:hypothetical protein
VKKILIGILISAVIIIIADIILVVNDIPTISKTILYYTFKKNWQVFPYFIGILTGHFFIPHKRFIFKNKSWIGILIVIGLFLPLQLISSLVIFIYPMITVGIGVLCGTIFWCQEKIK